MSSPSSEVGPPMEEKLEVPSPHPTDVPEEPGGDEGGALGRPPSPDAPGIELKESSTVLSNPLTDEMRLSEPPEADETKKDCNEHDVDTQEAHSLELNQPLPSGIITATTTPSTPVYITECATIYSIVMFCLSSSLTGLFAYYAFTGDRKASKFWSKTIIPTCMTAMGISFVLKPRRDDWPKIFLIVQYVLFMFVVEILTVIGNAPHKRSSQALKACGRSLLWFALLKLGLKSRSHIAKLPDEDLSNFLVNAVIWGGMLIGLGQLAFLMFASIQCDGSVGDWTKCNRTLDSQTGLGGMVAVYVLIKLASGVVPKRILDKHVLSLKKVIGMELNVGEFVQSLGLSIAAVCALFMLGKYGAKGDFDNDAERQTTQIVPTIGAGCLGVTAAWKLVAIRREMRDGGTSSRRQVHQGQSFSEDGMLVEASSFWFYVGVIATIFQSSLAVARAGMMDEFYKTMAAVSFPIVILIFVGSLFSQPRRRSPKDMWKLRIHFIIFAFASEAAFVAHGVKIGSVIMILLHFVRLAVETFIFHFSLKLRAVVGRLPDKDLETFIVNSLFKGSVQALFSVLFLFFRTTKCMFEKHSVSECSDVSSCSMYISFYVVLWWGMKIIRGSIRSDWQNDLNLSIEKIATLRGISLRRGIEGFLIVVTTMCGTFLFSMMSADKVDSTTISVVGTLGLVAIIGAQMSQLYSSLEVWELSKSSTQEVRATENEERVQECSWVFVGISFFFTSIFSVVYVCFSLMPETKLTLEIILPILYPIAALSFVMAIVYKPKRTDAGYRRFLYFHFFSYAIVSEIGNAVGQFRSDSPLRGWFGIFRIPLFCFGFKLFLKLRESAAKLPPQELSEFLCQTVLVKGMAAMSPMIFFSFEIVSCFISQKSFHNGQCANTSFAAKYLSLLLVLLTALSIANKTVPKSVRMVTAWELSAIATLKGLKWWQVIQGGLITFTSITSLYLLSNLGVIGEQNDMVVDVGVLGVLSTALAVLIGMVVLVRTINQHNEWEMPKNQRSVRGISATNLQDGMFIGAVV